MVALVVAGWRALGCSLAARPNLFLSRSASHAITRSWSSDQTNLAVGVCAYVSPILLVDCWWIDVRFGQ